MSNTAVHHRVLGYWSSTLSCPVCLSVCPSPGNTVGRLALCSSRVCGKAGTVVPALSDPRRERTPAMYGHVTNVPTHFNVKLPAIGGHLPNADADSHLLVVRTCYNGQFKQMPRFRRSFQPKIAPGGHPNLRPTFCSNVHAAIW